MRTHPKVGHQFQKSSPFLKTAAAIVYHHHEAYDGGGYPDGLKGEQIPIGARIFSLVDSYDAMRSPRVYKASIPREKALEEVRHQSGRQFDPMVVSAFFEIVDLLEKEAQWPNPDGKETGNENGKKDESIRTGAES
jgi:response regulator RpfG family c-di-GMP phosphodiesterase